MNAPPKNIAVLILQQTGQIFPLDQALLTIGRKSGNTIVLGDDLKVSRHHATISREGDDYILNDVGSANGTYLNDHRLTIPQFLSRGDIIQIGDATFEVKIPLVDTELILPRPPAPPPVEIETDVFKAPAAELDTGISDMETVPTRPTQNPYVGPRTFTQEESDRFFGREREARELLSLIISNRLGLFYAQSGAGKSSLLNARLIPQLRAADKSVLPIGRVSGAIPEGVEEVENIYVFNLLLSLDESDGDPTRFTRMNLSDFLLNLTSLDGLHYYYDDSVDETEAIFEGEFEKTPYILIIDQFEEILTNYPERWQQRQDFFKQLAQAMADDPLLWVVLSLREDYVAALDPYLHLLPDNLRARFYMQRMEYEAALEAVTKPAEKYGRPFAPGAAESLVNNLRQIRVQHLQVPEQTKTQLGQFVEPVQLQVVCYQLWENLKERPLGQVTEQDLQELGDVDAALAQFYEQALDEVVRQTKVAEIDLRNWFETQLITEASTRGTVYRGQEETGGIPNRAVDLLTNHFVLRSEARTGGTWYELIHDRFVIPILRANQAWRLEQPLIQLAHDWEQSGRSPTKLLEGQQLKEALGSKWRGLGPLVEEFLMASQTAQRAKEEAERAEKEQQRQRELEQKQQLLDVQTEAARKLRRRAWLLGLFVVAALLMAVLALFSSCKARENEREAVEARDTAQAQATAAAVNADTARTLLDEQKATRTVAAEAAMQEEETMEEAQALEATEVILIATSDALATGIAQTATAEHLNQLPADTPIPSLSTVSPTGIFTPPPTDIPTSTPTATPNATATKIAEELAQIKAQQEALAPPPIQIPPPGRCDPEPQGLFRPIWDRHKDRLGCPLRAEPFGGFFAEQPFERGFMIWSQILELFVVATGDSQSGTWQSFNKADVDSFNPQQQEVPCDLGAPTGLYQPIRGFGAIWCAREDVRQAVGYGTAPEYGVQTNLIQEYEHGSIIKDSQNRVFALFDDNHTYERAQ